MSRVERGALKTDVEDTRLGTFGGKRLFLRFIAECRRLGMSEAKAITAWNDKPKQVA